MRLATFNVPNLARFGCEGVGVRTGAGTGTDGTTGKVTFTGTGTGAGVGATFSCFSRVAGRSLPSLLLIRSGSSSVRNRTVAKSSETVLFGTPSRSPILRVLNFSSTLNFKTSSRRSSGVSCRRCSLRAMARSRFCSPVSSVRTSSGTSIYPSLAFRLAS